VKTDVYSGEHDTQTIHIAVNLNWSTIQHNISRYFSSYTDIYFLSGEYILEYQLSIANVGNFTITGRATVVFKCDYAGVFIIFVRIQNVHFVNCGTTVTNTTSTLNTHNVNSTVLSDIVFENSGIAGLVSSVSNSIIIRHRKGDINTSNLSYPQHLMGRIITDTTNDTQIIPKNVVLIKHCTICCMSDGYSSHVVSDGYSSFHSMLGLFFHEKTFSMNVDVVNITVTNIVSQNTSLVMITYNSSMQNSVSISNSNLTSIDSL